MAKKFLDQDGLVTLWGRIKSVFLRNTSTTVSDGEVAVYDGSSGNIIKSSGQKLSSKVDKESGKGLSTNDYTTTEKNKLAGIQSEANKSDVVYNATSSKLTKTVNGTSTDIVSADKITSDGGAVKKVKVYDTEVEVVNNTATIKGLAKSVRFNGSTYDVDGEGMVDIGSISTANKVDGVSGETITRYGECATAAATKIKAVSITSGTFALETGARVTVKFSAINTHATPQLKVGGTDAKAIFINGAAPTSTTKGWLAGVVDFVYDGTQWQAVGYEKDTTYSAVTEANIKDSSSTKAGLITGQLLNKALESYVVDNATLRNLPGDTAPHTVSSKELNEWLNAKLSAIVDADADGVINKFNEVVNFLDGVSDTDTLTSLIDIASNGGRAYYGTCTTGASVASKVITLTGDAPTELKAGDMLAVVFSQTNTADNPSLKIGSIEKQIVYGTSVITSTLGTKDYAGLANVTILYVYNGVNWVWCGWSKEPDSLTTSEIEAAIDIA